MINNYNGIHNLDYYLLFTYSHNVLHGFIIYQLLIRKCNFIIILRVAIN